MKVAIITRSTLYSVPGGDTIQVEQTARHLRKYGVEPEILRTNEPINYRNYDLFHFFNITRPADILFHTDRVKQPYVITPLLVDYSEYDKHYRKGLSGLMMKNFSAFTNEYIKTMARWITGKDILRSKKYIWKGQRRSMRRILSNAAAVLPNSAAESMAVKKMSGPDKPLFVIPNGIDASLFIAEQTEARDDKLVICVARIEGIKNQLNLIKALNNTSYTLMLVGSAAPNQKKYYYNCRREAAGNIIFQEHIPQDLLTDHYKKAKVHVLPSWFETCGLSSLEAAAMGCNIVITSKGYTRDYFDDDAFYCDPGDINSIAEAVSDAAAAPPPVKLQQRILEKYTWEQAALKTFEAYKSVLRD